MPSITSGTTVGLTWVIGAEQGGSEVIDYQVDIGPINGDFATLEAGITEQSYTATELTPGTTYKFRVKARSNYGYGAYSDVVLILAAQVPD